MLTDAQTSEFHNRGFLNGGLLLDDGQVEALRRELDRVIRDRDRTDVPQPVHLRNLNRNPESPVWQIVNIWAASDPFRKLTGMPRVVEEVAQLTGAERLRVWHDQIQYKPAERGGVTMWHQDAPLWPILAPMTEVSAWVALDDVDESNGCMSMVPGSHLWGNQIEFIRSVENYDDMPGEWNGNRVEIVRCPVEKGEGTLPPRADLARIARQHEQPPPPRHRHPLYDPRDALRGLRTARDETLRRGRRRGVGGR